jgi:hypothetical protein
MGRAALVTTRYSLRESRFTLFYLNIRVSKEDKLVWPSLACLNSLRESRFTRRRPQRRGI